MLSVAQLAAVMAVKQCSTLIPLCHTIPIMRVDVFSNVCDDEVVVRVTVKSVGANGRVCCFMNHLQYDKIRFTQTCN